MDAMQTLGIVAGAAIAFASALATVWRPEWPGYRILNMIAQNYGQARNAVDSKRDL